MGVTTGGTSQLAALPRRGPMGTQHQLCSIVYGIKMSVVPVSYTHLTLPTILLV